MKWFLSSVVCLLISTTLVRADAAADLYNASIAQLQAGKYAEAAKGFDDVIAKYPTTPYIDDVRLRSGYAYLHLGDNANSIDRLAKLITQPTTDPAKVAYRITALFFTGSAQFALAQKLSKTDKPGMIAGMAKTITTLTTLLEAIAKNPSADNKVYVEDALYYRSLAEFLKEDYPAAEKDLQTLLQPPYDTSLKKPDYLLLLGGLYFNQTAKAVDGKKSPEEIKAAAQKALDTFDKVANDPNALVQANEANMNKAQILNLIAQFSTSTDGYQTAIDAFHKVRRKDDMIKIQQERVDQLIKNSSTLLQQTGTSGASLASANSLLIDREKGRLTDLQGAPDPIIEALIGISGCYMALKEANEARVVLRRLTTQATLTPDQQKQAELQIANSYAMTEQVDKADKALTAYLTKYPADPFADSISFINANTLLKKKDYEGALKQATRSLDDFPAGRNAPAVLQIKVDALNKLGRFDDAKKATAEFEKKNSGNPAMVGILISNASALMAQKDYKGALETSLKVRDNAATTPELQSYGAMGVISALSALKEHDKVIAESATFISKYPNSKLLPNVALSNALALQAKGDPGAIAALQKVAKDYPNEDLAAYALSVVVSTYNQQMLAFAAAKKVEDAQKSAAAMIQATDDLFKAYPTKYTYLTQAAKLVGDEYVKAKKFDLAAALYQKLADAPPEIAAAAEMNIGAVWYAAAKGVGTYLSMPAAKREEAQKLLSQSEQAYVNVLKKYPDQLGPVGDALDGLIIDLKQRRSWTLIKDDKMEETLDATTADLTTPDMKARVELAKTGLVFIIKGGAAQYPAAAERFKKVVAANPSLALTRQEAGQFGDLLIAAKDYPTALKVYGDLLANAPKSDTTAQAEAYYGLGATYLAQGDIANAKKNFRAAKDLPGSLSWNQPHLFTANYGIALADENSKDAAEVQGAKKIYSDMMVNTSAGNSLQAKALLGYGRIEEKAGHLVRSGPTDTDGATEVFTRVDILYGPSVPQESAEGLYLAGQAFAKAGDTAKSQAAYKKVVDSYAKTAPEWAAKAQAQLKP